MNSKVSKFFVGNLVLPIALCLMGSIHPVALASAQTTQTITLISGNGPIGSRDPANQFTLNGGVTWQDAYIIDTYSYYAIIPGTQFINRNPDFFGPEHAATWYRSHFVLPSGFSSPSLTVLVHADNVATIFLNGVQIGQQPFVETFLNFINPPESFTATDQSLFQAGVNILEFDIFNFCCITAFDYKATVSFTSVLQVAIDIKPGSDPNSINPMSKGKIPVAILSTEGFDAPSQIDQNSLTLRFGSTGNEPSLAFCNPKGEDINGDGLIDLVCHFYTQDTGFGVQCGDTEGVLKGMTKDGISIQGIDSVRIVPCKK